MRIKLSYLLPLGSLALGHYIAEARDYVPPALPQGERYVSAQLFGVSDIPARHMLICSMPSRTAIIGERAIDEITVKALPKNSKRVIPDTGWHPWAEFAKLDRRAAGRIDSPTNRMDSPQQKMPEECPIPEEIWRAINELDEIPAVKGIIAGAGWVESRWDVNCHHYDNDGGYSHGWLQLHGRWRKTEIDIMESQAGGWRCPKNNLAAFLRTVADHERYYPDSKKSWKMKLARYNGGSRPNLAYASKCLLKAKELVQYFN